MNAYVEELFESENVYNSTKLFYTLLDDRYDKEY